MTENRSTFSRDDIEAARQQSVISPEAAESLASFLDSGGLSRSPSEEPFRLIGGFNDIFVALASLLIFIGVSIAAEDNGPWGMIVIAALSIGLSEYFTRRLRLRLTSLLYAVTAVFVLGHLALYCFLGDDVRLSEPMLSPNQFDSLMEDSTLEVSISSLLAAACAVGYWFRYRVPISIALAAGCVVLAIELVILDHFHFQYFRVIVFAYGLLIFAYAVYWDRLDPSRVKLACDVAFWLHLLAAPFLVNPVYTWALMGPEVSFSADSVGPTNFAIGLVFVIYLIFGFVALVINRRVFIVAGLLYVLFAIIWTISQEEVTGTHFAFAVVLMGSLFLLLAVWWDPIRSALFGVLPPAVQAFLTGQPTVFEKRTDDSPVET